MKGSALSVIIPTKDRLSILGESVEAALKATAHLQVEIIIVNDSLKKDIGITIKNENIKCIQNQGSGVAAARNTGAKEAEGELLLFLDDDILISRENIDTTLRLCSELPLACVNLNWAYPPQLLEKIKKSKFGRYLIRIGFTTMKGWNRGNKWDDTKLFETENVASFYLPVLKKDFIAVGGYNEKFPFAGAEDYDFSMRLKRSGFRTLIYPLSTVLHNENDRTEISAWLERKKRSAETRKVAVDLGYTELALSHSKLKMILYRTFGFTKPLLKLMAAFIPNHRFFDPIYALCIGRLLGIYLFDGYHKMKKEPK